MARPRVRPRRPGRRLAPRLPRQARDSLRVDLAAHAPHGRKHGTAFAESWLSPNGETLVAVGAVIEGSGDRVRVADLLRTGARALVLSRSSFAAALPALDRIVQTHAREDRDDALAAAIVLAAFGPSGDEVALAGAGRLHAALIDGAGGIRQVHARAAALGTGIAAGDVVETFRLHRDDLLAIASMPLPAPWWPSGDRTASALLRLGGEPDAAAAVIGSA